MDNIEQTEITEEKEKNLEEQSRETLEFNEVKKIIAKYASWSQSRNLILDITPFTDIEDIYEVQNKIRQINEIFETGSDISIGGFEDISELLTATEKGIILTASEFALIRTNIEVTSSLRRQLIPFLTMPFIVETVKSLNPTTDLLKAIEKTFDENGNIRNSASKELAEIRENRDIAELSVHGKINAILRDSSKQKMLQENIWTMREGRYVLPVKEGYRGFFNGLVLDVSSSGSTVFMEPLEIVDLNNKIKQYKAEEKAETTRILKSLGANVARNKRELLYNQDIIAEFDKIRALSKYCIESKGILPQINKSGKLILKKAKHPLLGEKAIPLDIEDGDKFTTLVITGPNTGGKTVTLKTAGLFSLMGLSGISLPADEGTEIPLFRHIYADIGDEQSISQNLSTFSSHMNKIVSILENADENSLVLLDELGAGTDPREGTALGIAILEDLIEKGARTIVTTHYGELKYFAGNHPKACNAAMEFDSTTLMPSYKITIGVPGRSCALEIASRLGLSQETIKRAESLISHEYVEMDKMLAEIESKEQFLKKEIETHSKIKSEAENLKNKYEEDISLIKAEQLELLADSAAETEAIINSAKREIGKIIQDFRKNLAKSAKEKTEKNPGAEALSEAETRIGGIFERLSTFKKTKKIKNIQKELKFNVGDDVYVPSMDMMGKILELSENEALISMNRLKMRIPTWNLRKSKNQSPTPSEPKDVFVPDVKRQVSSLNLIGKYTDEAIYELEKFIDNATLGGMESFKIIHGKGTGALRNAVRNALSRNKLVADFKSGDISEGGDGMTIVTLK